MDIHGLNFGARESIRCPQILEAVEDDGTPRYGIGLFEIIDHFIATELKFVRQTPLQIHLPRIGTGTHTLFLSSVFGALPQNLESHFQNRLQKVPNFLLNPVSLSDYTTFLARSNWFIRRFSSFEIEPIGRWHRRGDCLFLLDAESASDILDYWNLRALGWNVIPVCRQVATDDTLRAFVETFITENAYPLRSNPDIYNHTTLLPSGSTSAKQLEQFGGSLSLEPRKHAHDWKFVYQGWFPRIWDEWAREKDAAVPCELKVDEEDYEIGTGEDSHSFKSLMPKFAYRFGGHDQPRCANDLRLRIWSQGRVFAEVIPEGDRQIAAAAGAWSWREWRCSRSGLVHLPIHKHWRERMGFPVADRVFGAWLEARGWKVELSDKGHIAQQILKQLGGYLGIGVVALPGMVDVLEKTTRAGVIRAGALRGDLAQIAKSDEYHQLNAHSLLERLIDRRMVQLGLWLQCPTCRQRSWYSVAEADYELQCSKCLESFALPSPRHIGWGYRTTGPFSLPQYAYGAYAVLLTYRFFSRLLDGATTPLLSFVATKQDKKIEVDIGLFFQRLRFGIVETDLVIAECKTFSTFETDDVRKMLALTEEFPGAVLVFATLRRDLPPKEKKLLRPLVNRGRRYWKANRPYNPILILTGNELLTDHKPRRVWEKLGGRHASHARNWGDLRDLVSLADATQQIYLGMQPWRTWLEEKRKRRKVA